MRVRTFKQLQDIREKFGPGIFGKITQKLLALAFYAAGYSRVVERGVQGVDIDATNPQGKRFTVEVKTTGGDTIFISKDNIDALQDRASDGCVPLIAALRIQMFEQWIVASIPLSQLRPGSILLSRLRASSVGDIETSVNPAFETVVNQHFSGVMARGEQYLIEILDQRRTKQTPEFTSSNRATI
ncbi:MAG: hypothetical protein IIC91_00875 [Chloroflexi bacterium]|nr:hypothetical protein [Chloroflexota bacterium]